MRQKGETSSVLWKHGLITVSQTMHELCPSDYQLYQLERKRHGGGIAIYVICTAG